MLLQDYAPTEAATEFIGAWAPEDAKAHIEFQRRMNDRLTESGELVDAQALTGPELAKVVALVAVREPRDPQPPADPGDTLTLMFMSCHPELTPHRRSPSPCERSVD
jgi:hypothetical protein